MKRFTQVGRPPVETKPGNCPHCNSRRLGQLWQCGTVCETPDKQTRQCRIFQLEAVVDNLIAAIDEHGGPHWRDPMICSSPSWEPLRKAVAAAQAAGGKP